QYTACQNNAAISNKAGVGIRNTYITILVNSDNRSSIVRLQIKNVITSVISCNSESGYNSTAAIRRSDSQSAVDEVNSAARKPSKSTAIVALNRTYRPARSSARSYRS